MSAYRHNGWRPRFRDVDDGEAILLRNGRRPVRVAVEETRADARRRALQQATAPRRRRP